LHFSTNQKNHVHLLELQDVDGERDDHYSTRNNNHRRGERYSLTSRTSEGDERPWDPLSGGDRGAKSRVTNSKIRHTNGINTASTEKDEKWTDFDLSFFGADIIDINDHEDQNRTALRSTTDHVPHHRLARHQHISLHDSQDEPRKTSLVSSLVSSPEYLPKNDQVGTMEVQGEDQGSLSDDGISEILGEFHSDKNRTENEALGDNLESEGSCGSEYAEDDSYATNTETEDDEETDDDYEGEETESYDKLETASSKSLPTVMLDVLEDAFSSLLGEAEPADRVRRSKKKTRKEHVMSHE
jgi:hypothetical protein